MDMQRQWNQFATAKLGALQAAPTQPCRPYPPSAGCQASGLRQALKDSADLRALLAEYSAYGLAVPDSLAAEFEAAQVQVKVAAAEDRRQRLLAARAEVERLRSQEEKLAEARERLERVENEVRVAQDPAADLSTWAQRQVASLSGLDE